MSETGKENQVWTQNLKFEAKKGSQHWRRLWIVSFNLSLRASYLLLGSGTFLSIWREMKQRIVHGKYRVKESFEDPRKIASNSAVHCAQTRPYTRQHQLRVVGQGQ